MASGDENKDGNKEEENDTSLYESENNMGELCSLSSHSRPQVNHILPQQDSVIEGEQSTENSTISSSLSEEMRQERQRRMELDVCHAGSRSRNNAGTDTGNDNKQAKVQHKEDDTHPFIQDQIRIEIAISEFTMYLVLIERSSIQSMSQALKVSFRFREEEGVHFAVVIGSFGSANLVSDWLRDVGALSTANGLKAVTNIFFQGLYEGASVFPHTCASLPQLIPTSSKSIKLSIEVSNNEGHGLVGFRGKRQQLIQNSCSVSMHLRNDYPRLGSCIVELKGNAEGIMKANNMIMQYMKERRMVSGNAMKTYLYPCDMDSAKNFINLRITIPSQNAADIMDRHKEELQEAFGVELAVVPGTRMDNSYTDVMISGEAWNVDEAQLTIVEMITEMN